MWLEKSIDYLSFRLVFFKYCFEHVFKKEKYFFVNVFTNILEHDIQHQLSGNHFVEKTLNNIKFSISKSEKISGIEI